MKSFYEKEREGSGLLITKLIKYFPNHFHINLELFFIMDGEYLITINDKEYHINSPAIVVSDSYDVHGYTRLKEGKNCAVLIIPYSYLTEFNKIKEGKMIENPVIFDKNLVEFLLSFIKVFTQNNSEKTITSALSFILNIIADNLTFKNHTRNDVKLIRNILEYIENNLTNNFTRKDIAKNLGYTEEHLSRIFNRYIKKSISSYVNSLRLNLVEEKRKNNIPLTVAVFESGFQSMRTYYRVKKKENIAKK